MKISLALAIKLLRLAKGEQLPASSMRFPLVSDLIEEGIILDQRKGRSKSLLYIPDVNGLKSYLRNRFTILDLETYVSVLQQQEISRSDLTRSASDSKLVAVRSFKGFLVNSFMPIPGLLDGHEIIIHPTAGTFQFIQRYETFIPNPEVVIVNVENAENFTTIAQQRFLFEGLTPLFVSRYPQNQNKDLLKWLHGIPNKYLHYGDFDYAGINIYLNEYKNTLQERATFFVPQNLEQLLSNYGNPALYDRQKLNHQVNELGEPALIELVKLLQHYKKGLEQEALIGLTKASID